LFRPSSENSRTQHRPSAATPPPPARGLIRPTGQLIPPGGTGLRGKARRSTGTPGPARPSCFWPPIFGGRPPSAATAAPRSEGGVLHVRDGRRAPLAEDSGAFREGIGSRGGTASAAPARRRAAGDSACWLSGSRATVETHSGRVRATPRTCGGRWGPRRRDRVLDGGTVWPMPEAGAVHGGLGPKPPAGALYPRFLRGTSTL